jgi:hypothetical protein
MWLFKTARKMFCRGHEEPHVELFEMPKPCTDLQDERSVEELLERAATQHLRGRAISSSSGHGSMTVD